VYEYTAKELLEKFFFEKKVKISHFNAPWNKNIQIYDAGCKLKGPTEDR